MGLTKMDGSMRSPFGLTGYLAQPSFWNGTQELCGGLALSKVALLKRGSAAGMSAIGLLRCAWVLTMVDSDLGHNRFGGWQSRSDRIRYRWRMDGVRAALCPSLYC